MAFLVNGTPKCATSRKEMFQGVKPTWKRCRRTLGSFGIDLTLLFSKLISYGPAKRGDIIEPKFFLGAQTAPGKTPRGNKMFLKRIINI